jgi:hypothetical protein
MKTTIKAMANGIGIIVIFCVLLFAAEAQADKLTHKFKSPSFNGINTSSHYLTIENQEHSRVMTIKEEIQAIQDEIARDKDNTTLARFIRNLESRVYAQLSRQMVDNLFGETPSTTGSIELEGNTISYSSNGELITLTVVDADGTTTDISLPIGSFTF